MGGKTLQQPESEQVVGGEDPGGTSGRISGRHLLGRRHAGAYVEGRGGDHQQLGVRAGAGGEFGPPAPIPDLLDVARSADDGDPAVAEPDQVGDGQPAALDVVHRDRTAVEVVPGSVDDHHRDPAPVQQAQIFGHLPDRGQQDAANPLLLEQLEMGAFPLGSTGTVAELHGVATTVHDVLGAGHHVSEEGVGHVHHHHPNRGAHPGPQLASRLVARPTELGDGVLDPPSSRIGHLVRCVQDVGDRAHRHSGQGRDVLHTRRAVCH